MLQSDLLKRIPGIQHGFFTRQGGVSIGLYKSLNVGRGSDDAADNVARNRQRVADALGAQSLKTVYQVHSALVVDSADEPSNADGIVSTKAGEAVAVLTADCVPVLLAAVDGSRVAAVHAGWKGATGGILGAAVAHFKGVEVAAAVGPAIAQASYQVGQDVFDAAARPAFFKPDDTPKTYRFDLPGLVAAALQEVGVRHIDVLHEDTYAQPERFFSYRRATHRHEPDYGRQISAILRLPRAS
ncbi:MAG: peptidoglycan editing factor PgeF [Pseudomonadota bacterium]